MFSMASTTWPFLLALLAVSIHGGYIPKKRLAADVSVLPKGNNGLELTVKADGQDYQVNLQKPEASIFTPDFKFLVLDVNENGVHEIADRTPSKAELAKAEKHLYLTSGRNPSGPQALVKVDEIGNGGYRVNGYIDGHEISHDGDDGHVITFNEPLAAPSSSARITDYIDLGRNITVIDHPSTRQAVTGQPEVVILFDYANYQTFSGNANNINDYLSVFFHAVNNRYATFTDPSITFAVSGVFSFNSRAAQPFMEQSKIPDGSAYDMNSVLEKLSFWVYQNRATLPKHDVAALLSGEEFKSKDANGNYVSGIAGLAYLGGACWTYSNTRYLGTSVNADKGGFWSGVMTVSHELAHNLNAPHDGDSSSSSCPWSEGYIMSYLGYGTKNKFYFSSCSKNLMRTFISSSQGACVRSYQAPSRWTLSSANPGDRLDMTGQCKKYLNRSDAVVETANRTPTDMCRNLKCRVPTTNGYIIYTMNRIPGDNSPCGTNMVCKDGDCVTKPVTG